MSLVEPTISRQPLHRRTIDVQVYVRADGLFDMDANLRDVRSADYALPSGVREAGQPVHDMWLRVTINQQLDVIEAHSLTAAAPYPGFCEPPVDTYKQLIGLNLLRGFRQQLMQRLGAERGCSHLTELATVLPTAAIQALAEILHDSQPASEQPFEINRCHALTNQSAAVSAYYPKWYTPNPVKA